MTRKSIYLPGPTANDSSQRHLVPDAAIRGDVLFTGGVAGYSEDGSLAETHEVQAERIFARLAEILDVAEFSSRDIGHWFIWTPDRLKRTGDSTTFSKIMPINPLWAEWFPEVDDRPARHALARQLDPGQHYRVEIIAVKNAPRTSYEVEHVFHTGGSNIPHFMPFGTTTGDILFTGPTYGMDGPTFKVGETPYEQAELCATLNQELYRRTGHTVDNLAQMFVWYHDEASHEAAIKYTDVLFPNAKDRPAIHYIQSPLPGGDLGNGVKGQFFIQYDIIGVRNGKRRVIDVPGIHVLDGAGVPAGVAMGNLCFTSVVLGHDPRTGVLPDSLEEQTAAAFDNARAVVEAGGFDSADIGHAYVWYGSLAARDTVDNVWSRQFPDVDQRPARHCLVGNLPPKVLVGIELTAAK